MKTRSIAVIAASIGLLMGGVALAEEHNALTEVNAKLSASNAQLAHLAVHDPLTGQWDGHLPECRRGADRRGQPQCAHSLHHRE